MTYTLKKIGDLSERSEVLSPLAWHNPTCDTLYRTSKYLSQSAFQDMRYRCVHFLVITRFYDIIFMSLG